MRTKDYRRIHTRSLHTGYYARQMTLALFSQVVSLCALLIWSRRWCRRRINRQIDGAVRLVRTRRRPLERL